MNEQTKKEHSEEGGQEQQVNLAPLLRPPVCSIPSLLFHTVLSFQTPVLLLRPPRNTRFPLQGTAESSAEIRCALQVRVVLFRRGTLPGSSPRRKKPNEPPPGLQEVVCLVLRGHEREFP